MSHSDKDISSENYYLPLDVGGLQASSRIEWIANDWDITAFNIALSSVGGGNDVLNGFCREKDMHLKSKQMNERRPWGAINYSYLIYKKNNKPTGIRDLRAL